MNKLIIGKRYIIMERPLLTGEFAGIVDRVAMFKNLNEPKEYLKSLKKDYEYCYPFDTFGDYKEAKS